jgi:Cu2+-exporting ATPase
MAVPEVRNRKPGMMTLISLAISVAFVYSLFALFGNPGSGVLWEMATLIAVMDGDTHRRHAARPLA